LEQAVASLQLAGHDATAVEAQLKALPAPPPATPSSQGELSVLAADRKLGKAITSLAKAKEEVDGCSAALEAATTALAAAERVVSQREETVAHARVALKEASERRHELPSLPLHVPAPGSDVAALRSTVCSLRQLVGGVESSVSSMGPDLSAAWEAYAASGEEPKLPQTEWMLRKVATSLMTRLVLPAAAQCDVALIGPTSAASDASAAAKRWTKRARSSSPVGHPRGRRGDSRERTPPPRRGGQTGDGAEPMVGAPLSDSPLPPLYVPEGLG
jgi:hypothetical protein